MWIAVTGAQGSGKSTIAQRLRLEVERRGGNASSLAGIGAYVAALNLPLGESATRDTISSFLLAHVRRERHAPPIAIFDRCLVDLVAYALLRLDKRDPIRELVIELSQISLQRFTAVFMTRIPAERVNVASPYESPAFRARFEETLVYAASYCGATLTVLEGSIEERLTRAVSTIFS